MNLCKIFVNYHTRVNNNKIYKLLSDCIIAQCWIFFISIWHRKGYYNAILNYSASYKKVAECPILMLSTVDDTIRVNISYHAFQMQFRHHAIDACISGENYANSRKNIGQYYSFKGSVFSRDLSFKFVHCNNFMK